MVPILWTKRFESTAWTGFLLSKMLMCKEPLGSITAKDNRLEMAGFQSTQIEIIKWLWGKIAMSDPVKDCLKLVKMPLN